MTTASCGHRRGITLMEVLISIGILAIGLSSVVALVPAGKSEAAKAVMLDRGSNLAMNVLNDAMTFGLTRRHTVSSPPNASCVVFDVLCASSGSCVWLSDTSSRVVVVSGTLKPAGIYASSTMPNPAASAIRSMLETISLGRDDVLYTSGTNDDEPPRNAVIAGERSFQGRTSSLLSLTPLSGSLSAASLARLSVVVFHNRIDSNQADAILTGTYNGIGRPAGTLLVTLADLPNDRSLKEVIRPGTVVFCPTPSPAWYQVAMASADDAIPGLVYVTFTAGLEPPDNASVQIALDSIGLAERIVALEGLGPYGR
jgi:type II secretory pathway pseudopilin PulG